MNWNILLLFFPFLFLNIVCGTTCNFNNCLTCANSTNGCGWCLQENKCSLIHDCKTDIFLKEDTYNCPRQPDPKYPYDDNLGRTVVLPLVVAAYASTPQTCLDKTLPTMQAYKRVYMLCDNMNKSDYCAGFTAFDHSSKTIAISFRGSHGSFEMIAEFLNILKKKDNFLGIGKTFDYFNNAFYTLWNDGGMKVHFQLLQAAYPDYQVLVVGHSLGAALASLCGAFVAKSGMVDPTKLKVITFGEPRVGDVDYAEWYQTNLKYVYRIVHQMDPVPHLPPAEVDLRHHRFELWYKNDMTPGSKYELCPYGDLQGECSRQKYLYQWDDHTSYYHPPRPIPDWGTANCS